MSDLGKTVGQQKNKITCPHCDKTFTVLTKIMIDGGKATCQHCGTTCEFAKALSKQQERKFQEITKDRTFKIKL